MKKKPLNFAHRGFSGKYPENTMLAFQKAFEVGIDGIELDVQLTKDREVVIIHDSSVDRTTNGKGYVKDMTLSGIRQLNAAHHFHEVSAKETIPTLEEYLDWVKDKAMVTNIELKTNIFEYSGIEKNVIDLVEKFGLEDKIIFSSFNHYTIQRVKELNSSLKCGLLSSDWIVDFGKYTRELGVECVHPGFYMLQNNAVLKNLQENHLEINTWTVNNEEHMNQLVEAGITSIITNFPDKLKRILEKIE
ncbi:glycerophosphodiester phosphodiesterase [Desemzia sp. RIT804]|uniref:glycerophosphodiester phosphodiesterase n=1 Tax=Desemzia sp. RIT 804 TaxID=2810209 RepID=UPI00195016DB|nr:glycerophosphodiester phosphodiesterase [Desemzia sp. RIT 804]MBM6615924.1 glycerophosphodiester phosphodiesterase [Desemzia sp. RIT 804]